MRPSYIETRSVTGETSNNLAADIARHLHKRQHLGSVVVISNKPLSLMCVVRKRWMRLARQLQRDRASTVNAERILRLTFAVTHMHHMTFVARTPDHHPKADVFFMSPDEFEALPPNCYSLYLTDPLSPEKLHRAIEQLPAHSLLVDYTQLPAHSVVDLHGKERLVHKMEESWNRVEDFLRAQNIDLSKITSQSSQATSQLDDALDTLLACSPDFLRIASEFQHRQQLAQPIDPPTDVRKQYDTLALLAHRVQSLSSGEIGKYLDSLANDNTLFLRDSASEQEEPEPSYLAGLVTKHASAGRIHLARTLQHSH